MNTWERLNLQVNDWDGLLKIKFVENAKSGGTFCDVGACNGVFTSLFKNMAGTNGKTYAFELNPANYNNILGLAGFNCVIENIAVSDSTGVAEFYSDITTANDFTSNLLGYDTGFRNMTKRGEVNTVSLDEYFNGKVVDYIKIDVEGAELKVIKGALNTLKNSKYVIIECHFQSHWKDICDLLTENGLKFKNLVDDVPIYFGETEVIPGIASNGMPYQIYLKNEQ